MRRIELALLASTLVSVVVAGSAGAGIVTLDAGYVDGVARIVVSIDTTGPMPAEWVGIVVQRWTVGVCGSETIVTDEPLPIPEPTYPDWTTFTHVMEVPLPLANVMYRFKALGIDAGGGLHTVPVLSDVPPYDYVSNGLAIAGRGTLVRVVDPGYPIFYWLKPCPDSCWNACDGLIPLWGTDAAYLAPYYRSGIPVDVYSELDFDGMMPVTCFWPFDHVEPSPDGVCGPLVSSERTSWSAVKEFYR
jgi:hypothetical protein